MRIMLHLYILAALCLGATNVFAQKPSTEQLLGLKSASGRDFWVAIPPNELNPFPVDELEIYIASEFDTDVQIYDTGGDRTMTRKVTKGTILTLSSKSSKSETNWTWEVREFEQAVRKGIRITANNDIVVYVLNSKVTSSDGYLAIPTKAWGTDYIHCSYYDFREVKPWAGGFIVVASENGTQVEIDLRGVGELDAETAGGKLINSNKPYTVKLDEGDVYMVKGDGTTRALFDLTGSRITSSKPVGLISFHERTTMPNLLVNGNGRNHLCEMMPPVQTWGQKYATIEFKRENVNGLGKGDVFRVVAAEANTKWTLKYYDKQTKALLGESGGVLANAGDFADITQSGAPVVLTHGFSVWEADKPIMVVQYSCSQTWDGDPILDPFMICIAPLEQFSTNSVFQSPTASKFSKHRLNLIVWADSADPNYIENLKSLLIDSVAVWNHPLSQSPTLLFNRMPGGKNMHWVSIDFGTSAKSHTITSNEKIRCAGYLYGFGAADAYGWPVGAHYRDLSSIDTAKPQVTVSQQCNDFVVRAVEHRNVPETLRPKPLRTDQVETGISNIDFDPSFANTNFRLVLETAQELGEVPYKDFSFRVEVIDQTKDASARVRVQDFGFTEQSGPANTTYQTFDYKAPSVANWQPLVAMGKHRLGVRSSKPYEIKAGTAPLEITALRLANGTHFRLTDVQALPVTLAPGNTITLHVEYLADRDSSSNPTGADVDSIVVESGCNKLYATVTAFTVTASIEVGDVSFADVPVGALICKPMLIANLGSEALVITGIHGYEGTDFAPSSPLVPSLPITVPPNGSVTVNSMCFESKGGVSTASVTFSSNAALGDSVSVWTVNVLAGVEDEVSELTVSVAPLPANDVLRVQFADKMTAAVRAELVDVRGRSVKTWEVTSSESGVLDLSVSAVATGSYTLLVTFGDRVRAVPIVISR